MKIIFNEIKLSTKKTELIDISQKIENFVLKSEVKEGICLVYSLHTTTSIIVNEYEDGLITDILKQIEKLFPKGIGWSHDKIDDNTHAHLGSTFLGCSKTFPIRDGKLQIGTWQRILLLEMDGPRTRTIIVETIGK